jgi:hypothetical protein
MMLKRMGEVLPIAHIDVPPPRTCELCASTMEHVAMLPRTAGLTMTRVYRCLKCRAAAIVKQR